MAEGKVVDIILHCQKQIKKDRLPDDKLLHYLGRLSRLRVTVHDLAETGIGRTVNSLSRNEGPVGQAADTLVRGWKRMVSDQQNQAEKETEEEESESNSGSSEEEEDEVGGNNGVNNDNEPYGIDEPEETQPSADRRYSNGHSNSYDEPPPPVPHRGGYDEEDDEDMNDDIDDPYMDGNFLIDNVHSDEEDDEEDEDNDKDSDGSERLAIDADEINEQLSSHRHDSKSIKLNDSITIKQEKLSSEEIYPKSSHSSKCNNNSNSQHHKSHESDHHKKHSSSNSSNSSKSHHTNHERSVEKSQSSREQKHYNSSSKESSSSSRDHHRNKQSSSSSNGGGNYEPHNSSSSQHKSHHHHSSSKSEKSKESRSDHHHHKDKDTHRSKENSSNRDKEKEPSSKSSEKDQRSSRDKKESSDEYHHHRSNNSSSSSNARNKVRDPTSSSSSSSTSHSSPKKSSLENSKKESYSLSIDDRKRKELPSVSDSPSGSSASKKSKLVLKDEIDSNSGINFADVLGSLDAPAGNPSSKQTSSKKEKDKRKEDHDKGHHRRSHHDHHRSGLSSSSGGGSNSSSSNSKKHDSSGSFSSKHSSSSSSRDAGSSSSASSSKNKHDRESSSSRKGTLPLSKIESVIQPVIDISPNYKPMSSSLAKLVRPGHSSGSTNSNGFVAPPPIPLSQTELSDLGGVEYLDKAVGLTVGDMSQEDAISTMLSNRNQRSKVFSGTKAGRRAEVSSLFDQCMQVIKDNIGDLGYTGGIPYDILKPALERANPHQLINIESQNDYLIGETDELWQFHCKRDFRGKIPGETESWRELYERGTEERQLKFEVVKKKMKKTIEKAEPQRKAKLAYVDTSSSTRFTPQKAQTIKNGMKTLKIMDEKGPSRGVASSASAGFNNPKKSGSSNKVVVQEAAIIIAPESRAGHAPAPSVSREASAAKLKPKKAPLMQKTMKLVRSLYRH